MEFRDYLNMLKRRWRVITACVLVAIAAASFVTLQTTPQYSSTARLFISSPDATGTEVYQGSLFSEQRVTSYANLIMGEEIASRVIEDQGLNESPSELAEQITATVVPDTVIITVSVQDPSPQRSEALTQAVADEFVSYVSELETPPGKAAPPIKATVVDAADLTESPVSPKPLRNIALATVLGLLLGIGLAVLRESLDTTVKGVEEVAEILNASVLGSIRFDPGALKSPLIYELDSHSRRVEAFRVLRTNLQFVDVDSPSRVYVVTSSVPEEGKSTTAANLAITLAQAGQRVALVEADLRRPKIAEYLRLESAVGLTTALIGRIDLAEAVQQWGDDGMHVLTSGANPPNPAELLQSRAMRDVVQRLRQHYDIVLLDSPPLLPVTDASLLSAVSDGVLIVVRHGRTSRDQLRESVDRITSVGGRIIGGIVNRSPERGTDGYGYGYGYGYAPEPGRWRVDSGMGSDARATVANRGPRA